MGNRRGFTLTELVFGLVLLIFGIGLLALLAGAIKFFWTH